MSEYTKIHEGHWIYWDGWIGNASQRIDDATCSICGYQHPTVYWTKGDKQDSTPDKLADICPNCKAIMNKFATEQDEDKEFSKSFHNDLRPLLWHYMHLWCSGEIDLDTAIDKIDDEMDKFIIEYMEAHDKEQENVRS